MVSKGHWIKDESTRWTFSWTNCPPSATVTSSLDVYIQNLVWPHQVNYQVNYNPNRNSRTNQTHHPHIWPFCYLEYIIASVGRLLICVVLQIANSQRSCRMVLRINGVFIYAVATFTASRKHSLTTIFTAMIKYFMRVTGCFSFVERSGYVYGEPFYGEP